MSKFAETEKEKKGPKNPGKPAVQETVQRDLTDVNGPEGGMLPESVSSRIQSMRGTGQKLSDRNVQRFSQKFGRDMSDVHVHTDAVSDTISRSLNARAFTIGSDVFLTKGINPDGGGRDEQTMTHELTHVVQQGGRASAGPLKLGAADTAQEHEAESTAQREFDPALKEEDDTIQRGFWSDVGSAFASKALGSIGLSDAFEDFMSGDKKVKSAIDKMDGQKKVQYNALEENIKRTENQDLPDLRKELDDMRKRQGDLNKSINRDNPDPDLADQLRQVTNDIEGQNQVIAGQEADLQGYLNSQLQMLQEVDSTITKKDVDRYRSGKAKTFISSVFASIGGNILGSFESDPEKKAAAKKRGISSINDWFSSKNKARSDIEEESEEDKERKAYENKNKEKEIVTELWQDVQNDEQLKAQYGSWLLFRREIAKNHSEMIQEFLKENESTEDIKTAVMATLRSKSAGAKQPAQQQAQQPAEQPQP